ncbi:hypothetical protein ACJJTC_002734 [Scirpophaga incertulas]
MVEAVDFVALGELLAEPAASLEDDIKGAVLDPQALNKLRFALPTIDVLKAFYPSGTRISEKAFRDIKVKMLHQWPFTRALIMGPPAVANKIRGSAARTELFI